MSYLSTFPQQTEPADMRLPHPHHCDSCVERPYTKIETQTDTRGRAADRLKDRPRIPKQCSITLRKNQIMKDINGISFPKRTPELARKLCDSSLRRGVSEYMPRRLLGRQQSQCNHVCGNSYPLYVTKDEYFF